MPGHQRIVKMVELGKKSQENVKIEAGFNGANGGGGGGVGGIVFGHGHQVVLQQQQQQDILRPTSPPEVGGISTSSQSHYQHYSNVHSNHSNPPSPVPSSCVAPSSFPNSQQKVKITADEKPHPVPLIRPPSRKNLSATTPPPGPIIYLPKENEFGTNFKILPVSDQIRELQTIIRDKQTSRSDFKFYADRLIRLVIEESLNLLPFQVHQVITPTGSTYDGLKYERGNCGVSIVRSGESMEAGLRDCCRSIRIGKILVESDADTHEAHVVYARFPDDISKRKVILMYPIMSTGNTVIKSVNVLKEHHVPEDNIILANLFCTPHAVGSVLSTFPNMKILTSEIHPVSPTHFGRRYFGTD